jgi:hypothetical protein
VMASGVIYEQDGDVWFCKVDGKTVCCVACGKPIEHAGPSMKRANHKCPSNHDAGKLSANRRLREPLERNRSWGERFSEGCEMLSSEDLADY